MPAVEPRPRKFLLIATFTTSACLSGYVDHNQRTLLARNGEWTVTAIGPLDTVGSSFGFESRINVSFEVARHGTPYAAGHLYEAGPHDDPFNGDHPKRDWVAPNALRFWRQPEREYPFTIIVHNESARGIKWLRIRTTEIFLLFAIPSKATITLPSLYWGQYGFRVSGEFEDGAALIEQSERQKEGPRRTEIVIGDSVTRIM